MTPDQLVAAVRAALDDTERLARRATSAPWTSDDPFMRDAVHAPLVSIGEFQVYVADCLGKEMGPFARYNAEHIARHDPATVLRRVAADRRVLGRHQPCVNCDGECHACGHNPPWPCPDFADLADRLGIDPAGKQ